MTSEANRNLAVRFMTAGVAIPVLLWLMYWAPPAGMLILTGIGVVIAAQELFCMTARGHRLLQAWGILASLAVAAVFYRPAHGARLFAPDMPLLVITLMMTGSMFVSLTKPEPSKDAGTRMAWLVAGPFYAGALLINLANLHTLEHGGHWVLLSMLIAWLGDTGGYFAGRFLGKHKLYPAVSPKKTIEGSIGAIGGSMAGALSVAYFALPTLSIKHAVILTLIAAPLGQCGDLFASLIKRSTDTKDSGWIIPGHGGLLDRIDALLFTATVTWLYARYVIGA